MQKYSILGAMNICSCVSVYLSICLLKWILECGAHFKLYCIFYISKLGCYNFGGSWVGILSIFSRIDQNICLISRFEKIRFSFIVFYSGLWQYTL